MTPKSGRSHPRITVKRHRTWRCSNLLPDWTVEIPGYQVGRGKYRPPLRLFFTNHADALAHATALADSTRRPTEAQ